MGETAKNHNLVDYQRLRRQRNRFADQFSQVDYLFELISDQLIERLDDTHRHFHYGVNIGSYGGRMAKKLRALDRIDYLVDIDSCTSRLLPYQDWQVLTGEEVIPLVPESIDLACSVGQLQWINGLPNYLRAIRECLKPDGIFLASFIGGRSLHELRHVMREVEDHYTQGISPHILPFIDIKDAGALLQHAGFSMPVSDSQIYTVTYPNAMVLLQDLRRMGEGNAMTVRKKTALPKHYFDDVVNAYHRQYLMNDGDVGATFEIITLTAMR